MELFRADGHLTGQALTALCQDQEIDPMGRLEIAEHLSFCDACLQRYTDALSGVELPVPAHSCQKTIRQRIWLRTIRIAASRYATAAAAVALALTMLWGGESMPHYKAPEDRPAIVEQLRSWPEQCNEALNRAVSGLEDWVGGFDPFR